MQHNLVVFPCSLLLKLRGYPAIWRKIFWIAAAAIFAMANAAADTNYVHFQWKEVRDGVWFGVPQPNSFATTNAVIIALPGVGSMVVDSNYADFIAREIIEKAKQVAPGPVRYLINTHLHPDHVQGNEAFKKAFPQVEIIAHQRTCQGIPAKTVPRIKDRISPLRQELDAMRKRRIAIGENEKEAASALDRRMAGLELYLSEAKATVWVLPTSCLKMTTGQMKKITAGGRRMEIYYFGRGHTAGDLAVYLPVEKVLVAGDLWSEGGDMLLNNGIDGRDGSTLETAMTLRGVRKLDFDIALPGHREVIRGKASLDAAIMDDNKLVAQIRESYARGEPVDETLKKVVTPPNMGTAPWQRAVIRGYEEMELRHQLGLPER